MTGWIAAKRDGKALTADQIQAFIAGVAAGRVPDYQAAALLMAVVWRGPRSRPSWNAGRAP